MRKSPFLYKGNRGCGCDVCEQAAETAKCFISEDEGNTLVLGEDNLLYTSSSAVLPTGLENQILRFDENGVLVADYASVLNFYESGTEPLPTGSYLPLTPIDAEGNAGDSYAARVAQAPLGNTVVERTVDGIVRGQDPVIAVDLVNLRTLNKAIEAIPAPTPPCDDAEEIAECILSTDIGNQLHIGTDNLLYGGNTPDGVTSYSLYTISNDVDLSNTGGVGTPIVTIDIPVTFDGRPAEGLVTMSLSGENQTLIGNGDITYYLEMSFDGGTTWFPQDTMDVVRTGEDATSSSISYVEMEQVALVSTLNLFGAGELRVRSRVVVNDTFGEGSYVDLKVSASFVAGPQYNGVVE